MFLSVFVASLVGGRMPRHVGDRILAGARDTLRDGLVERKLSAYYLTTLRVIMLLLMLIS